MEDIKEVVRNLASIQRILSLDPIEGADSIECAKILGWNVVVKKGEFKVDDLVIYFEIDSWIPCELAPFLSKGKEPRFYNNVKGERLRTICLRGQVSQGLVLPVHSNATGAYVRKVDPVTGEEVTLNVVEGDDVTEFFGIQKWEAIISAQLSGQVRGTFPSFLIKTDSHRLQAYPKLIQEMQERDCYVTIKYDGTSSTFYNRFKSTVENPYDNDFGVCSRNQDLKEDENNTYWKMAMKYDLRNKLMGVNWAVQCETYGAGIQGNHLGLNDVRIATFDILDHSTRKYLSWDELCTACHNLHLPMVQVVYVGRFLWNTVDELIDFASGQLYPNGDLAEGIVIRSCIESYSPTLKGRLAFKVISPAYLMKYGG